MLQMIHAPYTDSHRLPLSGAATPFLASAHAQDGTKHLLLAASGSVATIKIPNMIQALSRHPNLSIMLIFTKSAAHFLSGQSTEQPPLDTLRHYPNVDGIFLDEEEWIHPWKRGQGILHIELRRWADILVIAPLSANMLAKIVGGFADNLLSSVVRAWDTTGEIEMGSRLQEGGGIQKRILVAPAMNTAMWRHPVTGGQVRVLEKEWGVRWRKEEDGGEEGWFEVLRPMEKELACGDVGDGAMKDWKEIVKVMEERLGLDGA